MSTDIHTTPFAHREQLTHDGRYSHDGKILASIRANQQLPYDWRHLTPGDLHEIGEFLRRDLMEKRTTLSGDVALAIAAVLTTGRSLHSLYRLKFYSSIEHLDADGAREGLAWDNDRPCWVLVAGSSTRFEQRKNGPELTLGDHCMRVPVFPLIRECMGPRSSDAVSSQPLFRKSEAAIARSIKKALRRRRGAHIGRPRRTSTTLESLERYLTAALTHQSRGGWAEAARYTARDEPLARTVIYYGESRIGAAFEKAGNATKGLLGKGTRPAHFPEEWDASVGSDRVAADAAVNRLSLRLRNEASAHQSCTTKMHEPLTNQVVALLSFAMGHRGLGDHLPSSAAIDWSTGFCRVHDKAKDEPGEARLIWVAGAARAQIREYEDHLARLDLAPSDFKSIQAEIASGRLPFFDLQRDRLHKLDLAKVWSRIRARDSDLARFSHNIGRQWLVSKLTSHCSLETVHAFFGHWQLGQEPWSYGSCMDPLHFKRELERILPFLLAEHGWAPLTLRLAD